MGTERLCERCDTPVTKRDLEQWFFRITRYAEELLRFDGLDWPEPVKTLQTNWIGRSEGAHVVFRTEQGDALEVFTTRPDTLWGATFMVLAPEHPLVVKLTTEAQAPRWKRTWPKPRARPISSARRPGEKRAACSPAPTR